MTEYTTPQAAAILGLHRTRVAQLCREGRLKARRVGRDWIIRESDLEAFRAQVRPPGRPAQRGRTTQTPSSQTKSTPK